MRPNTGFNLIELLITISIISLIAMIGFSSYSKHIVHAKRKQAETILSKLAIGMEEYRIENGSYKQASLAKLRGIDLSDQHDYQFIIQSATNDHYLLLAKPIGKQAERDVECGSLMMNDYGERQDKC